MPETKQPVDARYPLRLPEDLYEWLQEEAKRQYRSVNSLMVSVLLEYRERQTRSQRIPPGEP